MSDVILTVSFSKYLSDMIEYCTDTSGLYKNENEFITESVRSLMFDIINEEMDVNKLRQRLKMIIDMDEGTCYEHDISITETLYQNLETMARTYKCDVDTLISIAVDKRSNYVDDFILKV